MDCMQNDSIRALVARKIAELGKNMKSTSLEMGANETYIQQYLKRGIPDYLPEDMRAALAKVLGIKETVLKPGHQKEDAAITQGNFQSPHQVIDSAKENALKNPHTDVRLTFDDPYTSEYIPILGNANGSKEAVMLNFSDPIGKVKRYSSQENVKGAFALYARGTSMYPRYKGGELVFLVPNREVTIGNDCVVELNNGEAYLKEFVKRTDKEIICRQFNPAKEWKRPLSEIKAIHAVVGRG